MTSLINLVLINCEENGKGKRVFRRLDTNEIIALERIIILREPSITLKFSYGKPLPQTYSMKMSEYKMGADALLLLLGERVEEQDAIYYAASFCRIKKKQAESKVSQQ